MCKGLQTTAEWRLSVTREIDVPESAIQIIDVNVVASGSALYFARSRPQPQTITSESFS